MDARRIETGLAWFTLGALLIYAPVETWVSLPHGLGHPMYLVDVIGMVLLVWGGVLSLRARPRPAPGMMCAGWAWSAASGWRATSWRGLELVRGGGPLEHGAAEMWAVASASGIALAALALSIGLVVRTAPRSGGRN